MRETETNCYQGDRTIEISNLKADASRGHRFFRRNDGVGETTASGKMILTPGNLRENPYLLQFTLRRPSRFDCALTRTRRERSVRETADDTWK